MVKRVTLLASALIFSGNVVSADPMTLSCDGTMTITKPELQAPQRWHEAVSLDLKKHVMDGSLFGKLNITHETPASLAVSSDDFKDESGNRVTIMGTFDRLNGKLNLYNHVWGDKVASANTALVCEAMKPKF